MSKTKTPTTMADRCTRLYQALNAAASRLHQLSRYRKEAHAYDRDMGMNPRRFLDNDDWDIAESMAGEAAGEAMAAIRREGRKP